MKLTYRPEIDGLRAIAVSAVILYHTQINILGHQPFKGGFIGVDIFFVISGYLITSIILKELVTTGSFSFKHFYERRIRRILPALLFVMLVSLPFAWMYLLPSGLIDFSKSILYSLGFSSNFYFHYSGQEYGAESGLLIPFLHTWSLSVEEQFYILFPIVLLLAFKYFRKYLIHILILGFIISLGFAEWTSRNYPSASFYFLHTRMWELLAGSILAYFEITKGRRSSIKILNLILPFVGLFLIGHSILTFNDKMFHPSFYTLSPIIGVCLIIWFSNKDELITKVLSTKLFIGIGLISYSLYLWHYPIFAFARISEIASGDVLKKISIMILLFIISAISYYLIEQPFRNKKNKFNKLFILLTILILQLIISNYIFIKKKGLKQRWPIIFQNDLKKKINFYDKKNNFQKIILIGDSHADALEYSLNEELKKNFLNLLKFKTKIYLTDYNFINRKTKKIDENFIKNNSNIYNFLINNPKLTIVIHNRWQPKILEKYYDNEEGYKEYPNLIFDSYLEPFKIKTTSVVQRQKYLKDKIISQLNEISQLGHNLIIVYPVPEMGFNVPNLLLNKYRKNKDEFINGSIPVLSGSYEVYKKRNKKIFEILDGVNNDNVYRVYPHKIFCNTVVENRCIANNKEKIFYYDDDHLSFEGSKLIVNEIIMKINKINKTNIKKSD